VLDSIVQANPGRIALVVWHGSSSYPLYRQTAWNKWHLYPPPYNGGYAFPWLWVDGVNRSYVYYQWASYVTPELAETSVVEVNHAGTAYDPGSRTGTLRVACHNLSADTISCALQFVITEDSLYYPSPNGDTWHSNVCRDYIPDANGTPVVLVPEGTDTVSVGFSVDTSYNEQRCKLVAWLQNMTLQPDSSMPCLQGSSADLLSFVTGVKEGKPLAASRVTPTASVVRGMLLLRASGPTRNTSSVLLDLAGHKVMELHPGANDVSRLASGVYFVRSTVGGAARAKVVVQR
jgi:hypothetical protein